METLMQTRRELLRRRRARRRARGERSRAQAERSRTPSPLAAPLSRTPSPRRSPPPSRSRRPSPASSRSPSPTRTPSTTSSPSRSPSRSRSRSRSPSPSRRGASPYGQTRAERARRLAQRAWFCDLERRCRHDARDEVHAIESLRARLRVPRWAPLKTVSAARETGGKLTTSQTTRDGRWE